MKIDHIKQGHGTTREDFIAYCNSTLPISEISHEPKCFGCKKEYASEEERQKHLKEHDNPYVCPDCYWTFLPKNRGNFFRHIKNWHGFDLSAAEKSNINIQLNVDKKTNNENHQQVEAQEKTNNENAQKVNETSRESNQKTPPINVSSMQNIVDDQCSFSFDLNSIKIIPDEGLNQKSNSPLKSNAQEFLLH